MPRIIWARRSRNNRRQLCLGLGHIGHIADQNHNLSFQYLSPIPFFSYLLWKQCLFDHNNMVGMHSKKDEDIMLFQYIMYAMGNSSILILAGCTISYLGERNLTTTRRKSLNKSLNIHRQRAYIHNRSCNIWHCRLTTGQSKHSVRAEHSN